MNILIELIKKLEGKIKVDEDGCYIYLGHNRGGGYKGIYFRGKDWYAHRLVYAVINNDMKLDGVIDHTCHTSECKEVKCKHRHCINPDHLRLVTQQENLLSGNTLYARNAKKTHCNSGHEFNEQNTYKTKRNQRICKTCRRLGMQKKRVKQ